MLSANVATRVFREMGSVRRVSTGAKFAGSGFAMARGVAEWAATQTLHVEDSMPFA